MFKTIRAKIAVCFGGVIIFLFLLFGATGYRVLCDYLIDMQQQNQERLTQSLCSSISFFRQNCEKQMELLHEDPELSTLIYFMWEDKENRKELESWLDSYREKHDFIMNLYIINQAYEVIGTDDVKKVRTYLIDRISTAERYEGKAVWDSGYDTSSMMIFEKLNIEKANGKAAYLFLQIDNSQILDLFHKFRLQNSQRFSLKGATNGFEVTEQGFFYKYYDNYKELLHTEFMIEDWYLRTWSDKYFIMGPAKQLLEKMISVLIVALVVSIFVSIGLAEKLTKPINSMKQSMECYGKGDFSAKVSVTGIDEIGSLGKLLNQMAGQISQLFERVKQEEEQSRRLELQTMIYQINPHFLYNTLDSVNMIARKNGDIKVAELVTDLSRLFRISLNQGRDTISVQNELMHIIYYLRIQKFRFEEQFTWEIKAEPEVMDYEITKFILQPIVENAIYYGIKQKEEPGYLNVTVSEEQEFLYFTIEDTGKGMDENTLRILVERMESESNTEYNSRGFGLWNVNQRIKLCYGEQCGIRIESQKNKGTKIILKIFKQIPKKESVV